MSTERGERDPARFRALFLGGGPAAIGPLVCALQQGRLAELLDAPIAIVERGDALGRGTIGKYAIRSDTVGATLLECLTPTTEPVLGHLLGSDSTRAIAERRGGAVPLQVVGEYVAEIGQALREEIARHGASRFMPRSEARVVRRAPGGGFLTTVARGGAEEEIASDTVVLAMGASQSRGRALAEDVAGVPLRGYDAKVMLTDELLTAPGLAAAADRLRGAARPRVVVVGGSHSAMSAAWALLNLAEGVAFGPGDITLLHRGQMKIFYPSREAALADGYDEFGDDDFCPVTGRLFRLGGFRLDSRELLMRARGMLPGGREERLRLVQLGPGGPAPGEVARLLDEAALVVPAFGYRPNTVPVLDERGHRVALQGDGPGAPPLVDAAGRVLAAGGAPVPGLLGIGLASGFKLTGALGGEPSFTGQTNGLWLYQNGVGQLILDQVLAA